MQIINGKVWVHVLLGLSWKKGAGDALGQPQKGLTHHFGYPEPDRRAHTDPTGTVVTDRASSSSPISIPASFHSARKAAKAAVQPWAPLPKTCTVVEDAPLHLGRQDRVPAGSRTGDRHPPTEETTTKLILKIFSKEGIFFPPGEESYIIVSYVEWG